MRLPYTPYAADCRWSCSSPDRVRSTRRAVKVSCPAAYVRWPPSGSTRPAGIWWASAMSAAGGRQRLTSALGQAEAYAAPSSTRRCDRPQQPLAWKSLPWRPARWCSRQGRCASEAGDPVRRMDLTSMGATFWQLMGCIRQLVARSAWKCASAGHSASVSAGTTAYSRGATMWRCTGAVTVRPTSPPSRPISSGLRSSARAACRSRSSSMSSRSCENGWLTPPRPHEYAAPAHSGSESPAESLAGSCWLAMPGVTSMRLPARGYRSGWLRHGRRCQRLEPIGRRVRRAWRRASWRYAAMTHALVQATRPAWARQAIVPTPPPPAVFRAAGRELRAIELAEILVYRPGWDGL